MIIVTGGAGFIGSAVVWKLNALGRDDILIVDHLGRSDKWKNLVNRRFRDYMHKSEFLAQLEAGRLGKIEAVVHMGACSSTTQQDADYLMENNYHYSVALARFALKNGIRLINASSAATYGDGAAGFSDREDRLALLKPLNMYGYSKHLFDLWALGSGALNRLVSLKFFNVFGPNEYHKGDMISMVYKGCRQAVTDGAVRLFKSGHEAYADGEQKRDFVYVKDGAELIAWLLTHPEVNGLFNVGTGRARSWNAMAGAVFRALERPVNIAYIDMPPALRDRYQYFTQADMGRLKAAGCPVAFQDLEAAVFDYVTRYLVHNDRCL